MIVIERIPQTILDHDIDEFAVAHTQTPTSFAAGNKRSVGHAFHTAGNDDVVIASQDGLSSQFHTFQAGTADFIDSKSRNFNRQASFDGCLTSRVLAQSSLEDVTKNDFVNFFTRDISSFQASLMTIAPSSGADRGSRLPPNLPIAVLTALAITTSRITKSSFFNKLSVTFSPISEGRLNR